jgi:hypothetical protein
MRETPCVVAFEVLAVLAVASAVGAGRVFVAAAPADFAVAVQVQALD